jgi:hypothetical protein
MTSSEEAKPIPRRVIKSTLFRRRRKCVRFDTEPPPPEPPPARRPARVAQLLALAHKIQDSIDRGVVSDRATVARRLGFTRARVTQLLDLTLLAPDIQERLLELEAVDGVEPMAERSLRPLVGEPTWDAQREGFARREGRRR